MLSSEKHNKFFFLYPGVWSQSIIHVQSFSIVLFTWHAFRMCFSRNNTKKFSVLFSKDACYFCLCSVRPSLIEYLSYNLNFLSVLVGPCSDYQDYKDFIEGRHVSRRLKQHSCNGQSGHDRRADCSPAVRLYLVTQIHSVKAGLFEIWEAVIITGLSVVVSSLQSAVCGKLLVCSGCMLFFFTVTRALPIAYNADPQFVSTAPFLSRLVYAFFSIQAARPKFYFAWTLGEHLVFVLKCYYDEHISTSVQIVFSFLSLLSCQLMQSTTLQVMVSQA